MNGSDGIPAETAHLGSYDPFEAPLVLDLLEEYGIFAFSKSPLDQAEGQPYGRIFGDSGRGRIFVDASRVDEARRLVEEELPKRIAELQAALDEEFAEDEGPQEGLDEPEEDDLEEDER